MKSNGWRILLAATMASCIGCGGDSSGPDSSPRVREFQTFTAPATSGNSGEGPTAVKSATPENLRKDLTRSQPPAQPPTGGSGQDGDKKVASYKDGAKGKGYGNSYLGTVVRTRFTAENRINELNRKHAEDIYRAAHGNKGPQSHEEYMEKIIKANNIKLPELPEGEEYLFDPRTQELYIVRPKGGGPIP